MPELPEVETTRAGIAPHVEGAVLEDVIVRCAKLRYPVPATLKRELLNQRVLAVKRRAKYLLVEFERVTLLIHLGMSGSLRVVDRDVPVKKHDHVDFVFNNGVCLRYTDPRKFGAVLLINGDVDEHVLLKELGPEPLDSAFTGCYLHAQTSRRKAPIKTVLMDGHVVVGIGNIYANEALFLAGIDPRSPSNRLTQSDCAEIVLRAKQVLRKAIKAGGTTLKDFVNSEGKPGYFQQMLYVYGRGNQACTKCDELIDVYIIGQRSTFSCSRCQRLVT